MNDTNDTNHPVSPPTATCLATDALDKSRKNCVSDDAFEGSRNTNGSSTLRWKFSPNKQITDHTHYCILGIQGIY